MVGKIIWDWLRGNRIPNGRGNLNCHKMMKKAIDTIENNVNQIKTDTTWTKDIHAKTDESGRPKWYFPAEVGDKIDHIEDNTKHILNVIKQLLEENKAMNIALIEAIRSR